MVYQGWLDTHPMPAFECGNGYASTTINKHGLTFRHLSCYVRLHYLNSSAGNILEYSTVSLSKTNVNFKQSYLGSEDFRPVFAFAR